MWRVAANILNKQSRTVKKGVVFHLLTVKKKKKIVMKYYTGSRN